MQVRPGFTQQFDSIVSTHEIPPQRFAAEHSQVLSYSIPLAQLPIEPDRLAMWDDGLVKAWREDMRLVLLVHAEQYPPDPAKIRFGLTLDKHCESMRRMPGHAWKKGARKREAMSGDTKLTFVIDKPDAADITKILKGEGKGFYLSTTILTLLRSWPRCYMFRIALGLNTETADKYGLNEELAQKVLNAGLIPKMAGPEDKDDPVSKGYGDNVELCAFYWVVNRFVHAYKYCQVCAPSAHSHQYARFPSLCPSLTFPPHCRSLGAVV